MGEHQDTDAVVRAMFGGRRDGERREKTVWIEVRATDGVIRGRTIDISRSGILLCFDDVRGLDTVDALHGYGELMHEILGPDCIASLHYGLVMRRLQLIRATQGGLGGSMVPLLAFRFDRQLSEEECQQIGVPPTGSIVDDLIGV